MEANVSAKLSDITVEYFSDSLTVEVCLKASFRPRPITIKLTLSEAEILTSLLNFVMPHTSRVRVRKSMSP